MNSNFYVFKQDAVLSKGFHGTIYETDLSKESADYRLFHVLWKEVVEDQCYLRHDFDVDVGDIVVDIGANVGMFSRYALTRGASIVHGIEPHPTAFNCLVLNNGSYVNFRPHKLAIAYNDGFIDLHVGGCYHEDYYFMADILSSLNNSSFSYTESTITKSMDTLFECGLFDRIDFLKIDIEGAEIQLFEGISDENLKKVNKISVEYHPQFLLDGVEQLKERLNVSFETVYNTPNTGGIELYNYRRRCYG